MNEYRNILIENTARAFKKLISRFDWADDNDVVKHLVEVHERFCRDDCPLEKSNVCAQELEVRAPTISPHEPDEEKRAESTEYHVSDNHEKTMCLQMEVEDGAESVDDDSSGESDSDTESGEEFYIKDEKEFFHDIPCEISTYTISKGSSTMVRKDWSSLKTRSLVKPKSTKPLSSTRQKATHRHTKEVNKKGQLTSHTETLNQITLKSGVGEIHSRLDQTDILNPSAGNPTSVRHPEEASVVNNVSQLSCSVKSEPTELSELQGQSPVHPSDNQGIQSTLNFPLGVDQSTRKQVSTSGGDYQGSLHTKYVPPVPQNLSSVMPSIQEPLNLTLIINPVTGKPMLVRSPDVTESSHKVNQLNLKLTINPVSGESVLVPDIEAQSAAGKSGDPMLSPQMVLSPSSMALPSQAKTPRNDASEDQSENSHIQTVDLPSETDNLAVASKSDCIKRSSCRTSKRRISSTTTASASQNPFPTGDQPKVSENLRFTDVSCDDTDLFLEKTSENKHTSKKTRCDLRTFQEYLKTKGEFRVPEKISPKDLNLHIASFLLSVRKHDGSEYEPSSLGAYISSIDRYLKQQDYGYSIMNNIQFSKARAVLKMKQKQLMSLGKGNKPFAADEISDNEFRLFYEKKILGPYTPTSLTNSMFTICSNYFGIKPGKEIHDLTWGDIQLKFDEAENLEYIVYSQERQTKIRKGSSPRDPRKIKPRAYATPDHPEKDPVSLYKKYSEVRPPETKKEDSPFFLAVNTSADLGNPAIYWYRRHSMGINKLYGLVKQMQYSAGIDSEKRLTNHSMRKHLVQKSQRCRNCTPCSSPSRTALKRKLLQTTAVNEPSLPD